MIIAVDFDGYLTYKDNYPNIKYARIDRIAKLRLLRSKGHKLILWTCRSGKYLDDAVNFCKNFGLEFDAVNDNLEDCIEKYNNNCRKVFADIYLDDKNGTLEEL